MLVVYFIGYYSTFIRTLHTSYYNIVIIVVDNHIFRKPLWHLEECKMFAINETR